MEDLTTEERRLVLAALWLLRERLDRDLESARRDGEEPGGSDLDTLERIESAARKLGGDPVAQLFGVTKPEGPTQ